MAPPLQEGSTKKGGAVMHQTRKHHRPSWRHDDDGVKPSKALSHHFQGLWWGNKGEAYEVWPSSKVDGLWELERHDRSGKMRFTAQYNERSRLVWWGLRFLFFFDPDDMTASPHVVTWYSAKDRNKRQPAFVWRSAYSYHSESYTPSWKQKQLPEDDVTETTPSWKQKQMPEDDATENPEEIQDDPSKDVVHHPPRQQLRYWRVKGSHDTLESPTSATTTADSSDLLEMASVAEDVCKDVAGGTSEEDVVKAGTSEADTEALEPCNKDSADDAADTDTVKADLVDTEKAGTSTTSVQEALDVETEMVRDVGPAPLPPPPPSLPLPRWCQSVGGLS